MDDAVNLPYDAGHNDDGFASEPCEVPLPSDVETEYSEDVMLCEDTPTLTHREILEGRRCCSKRCDQTIPETVLDEVCTSL